MDLTLLTGSGQGAARDVGPAPANLFGLSLLRVLLRLLVNSGLQSTQPHTQVLPNKGQGSEGRAEAVTARDTPWPIPSLSSSKMSQVKGHHEPLLQLGSIQLRIPEAPGIRLGLTSLGPHLPRSPPA